MAGLRDLPPFANILLAIVLAAAVVAGGWFVPGSPVNTQRLDLDAANAEIATLLPQVQALEVIERQHTELKAEVAALEKQLEVLKTIVPEEKDVDEFIRMVHAAAASSNVEIRRITSKPVVAKEFYNELPFEIAFDGPYYSVMSFFAKLGRLSRIINVSDLSFMNLERAKKKGGIKYDVRPGTTVIATCTVTTFFTRNDVAAAPAKAATPGARPPAPAKR